jgi:hypothetical protein
MLTSSISANELRGNRCDLKSQPYEGAPATDVDSHIANGTSRSLHAVVALSKASGSLQREGSP